MAEKLYRCICGFESDENPLTWTHPELGVRYAYPGFVHTVTYQKPVEYKYKLPEFVVNDNLEVTQWGGLPRTDWGGRPRPPAEVDPITDPDDDFYRSPSER